MDLRNDQYCPTKCCTLISVYPYHRVKAFKVKKCKIQNFGANIVDQLK